MKGEGALEMIVDVPGGGENIVALPEIVGRLLPIIGGATGVLQEVTLGLIVAAGISQWIAVGTVGQGLIEGVVTAKTGIIKVFIGLDAGGTAVGAVHQRQVVVAGCHSVPSLSCLLKVAEILVADGEVIIHIAQTAIVGA